MGASHLLLFSGVLACYLTSMAFAQLIGVSFQKSSRFCCCCSLYQLSFTASTTLFIACLSAGKNGITDRVIISLISLPPCLTHLHKVSAPSVLSPTLLILSYQFWSLVNDDDAQQQFVSASESRPKRLAPLPTQKRLLLVIIN